MCGGVERCKPTYCPIGKQILPGGGEGPRTRLKWRSYVAGDMFIYSMRTSSAGHGGVDAPGIQMGDCTFTSRMHETTNAPSAGGVCDHIREACACGAHGCGRTTRTSCARAMSPRQRRASQRTMSRRACAAPRCVSRRATYAPAASPLASIVIEWRPAPSSRLSERTARPIASSNTRRT